MQRRRRSNSSTGYGHGWPGWLVMAGMILLGLMSILVAGWRRVLQATRASLLWFHRLVR